MPTAGEVDVIQNVRRLRDHHHLIALLRSPVPAYLPPLSTRTITTPPPLLARLVIGPGLRLRAPAPGRMFCRGLPVPFSGNYLISGGAGIIIVVYSQTRSVV